MATIIEIEIRCTTSLRMDEDPSPGDYTGRKNNKYRTPEVESNTRKGVI
jgi:hypothetical protein